MGVENLIPPGWWPPGDPGPDDPWGGGHPWWQGWLRRKVPFPHGDPPGPILEKLTEIMKKEDLVQLEGARLDAMKADFEAGLKYVNDIGKTQLAFLEKQMKILGKYRGEK